ncbi:UbiA family prenyltransferase [Candidatus Methanoperedens nitratireducens]|uniref:4-hydroxybenzoate polyprenyltransferase-like prenyltransferase n=1 Tax=Candidatus Methanoperedens nitratireducens TaxID=1392998 RepID=A0A284VTB6_9EURY|nr:UbiA family prenyltransferase [Candidatus Methanoperedens nitroreducens]SNQ62524.1 membrane hypothetical protein [Candidatus Methanoperedens nitroreducens]
MSNINENTELKLIKDIIFDFRFTFDLITAMVFLLTGFIISGANSSTLNSIMTIFIMYISSFQAHLFNHIKDNQGDILNKKSMGNINTKINRYYNLFWILFFILVFLQAFYLGNPYITIFWIVLASIKIIYSAALMKKGWLGIISISVAYVAYFYYGIALGGTQNISEIVAYSSIVLIFLLGTTPLKDIGDLKGDAAVGKITPAIIHGSNLLNVLSKILLVALILSLYFSYLYPKFWYIYIQALIFNVISVVFLHRGAKEMWGIVFQLRMYFISIAHLWVLIILIGNRI